MECLWPSVIERSQRKEVKPKKGGRKLRSGLYWQGALKQKRVKEMVHKTSSTCIHKSITAV
jgi:hypothetical protein